MFKSTTTCPINKNTKKEFSCKGVRENGTLKNACAACDAYKKYVSETIK